MCIIDEVSIVIQFINKKVFLNFLLYFLSNPILQDLQNKYFKLPMLSCPVINISIPYTYRVLQVVVFIQFRIWWFQKEFDLNILNISNVSYKCVVPGGAGVAMALPEFGRSTRRGRLCPPHYYWHSQIFIPSASYGPEIMQKNSWWKYVILLLLIH